jgi:hypothetical protein
MRAPCNSITCLPIPEPAYSLRAGRRANITNACSAHYISHADAVVRDADLPFVPRGRG